VVQHRIPHFQLVFGYTYRDKATIQLLPFSAIGDFQKNPGANILTATTV
jgi:hypothetical protein